MKRLLLAILSVCCATLVHAQRPTQEVLYLKNGSVIKGIVLPSAQGSIKIQTRDGSVFVYDSNEVESVKSEQITHTTTGKKILDFPKHSFGVKAGGLSSICSNGNMVISPTHVYISGEETPDTEYLQINGGGFYIGGTYEVALTKTNKWFFQTGIDLQYINTTKKKNFIADDHSDWKDDMWMFQNIVGHSLFLDIPMMFSCKLPISKEYYIAPSFGLTHTIGLFSHFSGERQEVEFDDFSNDYKMIGEMMPYIEKGFGEDYEIPTSFLNRNNRYSLNFKLGVEFGIKKHIVVGIDASMMLTSSYFHMYPFEYGFNPFRIGLSVGYKF